jgi:flagellar hook protein FlgE
MSLSSAMLVGYTGIKSNSVMVDTVGDNLANVNTTAFKGQRTLFETLLYDTIREGEGPSATSGGTLPFQIGRGSTVAAVQRDFRQGSFEATAAPSDLAVDGQGFFILDAGQGTQAFTRDGAFHLDASQTMVSLNGNAVQVFPADPAGQIDPTTLSDLVIPLGSTGPAIPTTQVTLDGQLDSGTTVASGTSIVASEAFILAGGTPATASTPLTNLVDSSGVPIFASNDTITFRVSRGGISLPDSTFTVGQTGSTLGDMASHLESILGLTGGAPAGVIVADGTQGPAGTLRITSYPGEVNAVEVEATPFDSAAGIARQPISFSTVAEAVGGGGVTTSFSVFDSLGEPADVRLRLALESESEAGSTWRFWAESVADTDLTPHLGTGTLQFDSQGRFVGATGTDVTLDRVGTGAASPLSFALDFSAVTSVASADATSELMMRSQDGAPAGVLIGYAIDRDGVVTGAYSNQLTVVLGQIALATFTNEQGLIATSENSFLEGVNSGAPSIVAPRTGTAGAVASGNLEQSNVEIAREFLNLITASTGITAAGRVVRVADDLLQRLLLVAQ